MHAETISPEHLDKVGASEPARLRPDILANRKAASALTMWQHYALAFGVFTGVSLFCLWLQRWMGYQAIALVYLLSVVLLALFMSRGPIVFGTILTAAGWNFFFAPPVFAFNISDTYDNVMLVTYFVVTMIVGQLTARLRAQRDAEIRAKLLVESERLGRTLLNSVSHELRTPIAAIISASTSLSAIASPTPEQQNLITEIELATARLNRVVQSLLSAARIQSGQLRPRPDWCDIADLVRVSLRTARKVLADHPITTHIAQGMQLVKADFLLTEQALSNLLVNAALHTPAGTPIQVAAYVEKKFLVLEVADYGPGLPAELLERVFEPFHRAQSASPGGVGLGLTIVKGFIETQGGRVRAANRPSRGAVFSLFLPIADAPDFAQLKL